MEMLLEKTRKTINIKDDLVARRLTKSCVSYSIRTRCDLKTANAIHDKWFRPLIERVGSAGGHGKRNIDQCRVVTYYGGNMGTPRECDREIGIMVYNPDFEGFPDDLNLHHGSYNLYITNVTNN